MARFLRKMAFHSIGVFIALAFPKIVAAGNPDSPPAATYENSDEFVVAGVNSKMVHDDPTFQFGGSEVVQNTASAVDLAGLAISTYALKRMGNDPIVRQWRNSEAALLAHKENKPLSQAEFDTQKARLEARSKDLREQIKKNSTEKAKDKTLQPALKENEAQLKALNNRHPTDVMKYNPEKLSEGRRLELATQAKNMTGDAKSIEEYSKTLSDDEKIAFHTYKTYYSELDELTSKAARLEKEALPRLKFFTGKRIVAAGAGIAFGLDLGMRAQVFYISHKDATLSPLVTWIDVNYLEHHNGTSLLAVPQPLGEHKEPTKGIVDALDPPKNASQRDVASDVSRNEKSELPNDTLPSTENFDATKVDLNQAHDDAIDLSTLSLDQDPGPEQKEAPGDKAPKKSEDDKAPTDRPSDK